ncbi:cbb3-type cytochrome c oxidase subunit I, partial [Bacillus pumilus]|uniref:cbb3-type cytochrome c oxidase subunit I n=1 Tax=Bacillus pumilus TaxID=1408 RepID=UPI0037043075
MNFLPTIINIRTPPITYITIPLFTSTTFLPSPLILFPFPPLTPPLPMLMLHTMFHTTFFNPHLPPNTIICQHLFSIFPHPQLYILIFPP